MTITVVNKYQTSKGEYIGRGSPLGNPYSHLPSTLAQFKVASRAEAIEKYREWLVEKIQSNNYEVIGELTRLKIKHLKDGELALKCCCKPHPCHGDVIKQLLETGEL